MRKLRARHWLAVTLALILIVVAYRADVTVVTPTEELAAVETLTPTGTVDDEQTTTPSGRIIADDASDETKIDTTTTTEARRATRRGATAPLTGLPVDKPLGDRPALVIKIDNHAKARPQTGLDQADIVFDMRAEGVTRFAAVFHSQLPDPVGPVRSSRTSDFDLLRGLDNPLYGSSGGNEFVIAGLRDLPITAVTNHTRREYFRNRSRPAPHNLYVNTSDLLPLAPEESTPPEPWFTYRAEGDELPESATRITGPVSVDFTGTPVVTHTWDQAVGGWARSQDGNPHNTVDGAQLAPENVVILVTSYSTSPADPTSPEVRSVGDGPLFVLTDGHVISGTWQRSTAESKPILLDSSGATIALTPGQTWVLLPEEGQVELPGGVRTSVGGARGRE